MGVITGAANLYFIYKFIRILTTPFNKTDAFKLGIVDENGKILKKKAKLKTDEEKDAYTMMHRLVWKLKRLMEKIPFGKSRLASYAAALWLIKENKEDNISEEELQESFLSFLETDWENDALILKENYEGDLDKKTFEDLKEGHKKVKLPPHLAKFFDKKGNLKKDAADRVQKGRAQRGVKITDRTPDWMFEIAPPGWEGTVKAMKKKKGIDNPYALAWHMHNKGMKPHIPEELGGIMGQAFQTYLDEKRKSLKNTKDVGMECQECGKKFRAKLSTLEYGKTKCPKCKSTDLDFQFGEQVVEGWKIVEHKGTKPHKHPHEDDEEMDEKKIMKLKIKPKKIKKMKDLRLYAPSKKKSSSPSSSPHVPAYGISRKGGYGAGHGYGKHGGGPIMFGEEEINEKEAAYPSTIENLKKIVKDKQNQVFAFKDGGSIRVDLFSASALVQVYNALKPATRKKFETMIKTKGGFVKSVDFAFKMAKEEVDPHAKVMAKKGDSPEKIKDMHPEITDDELEKLFKEEFNISTVTTFKSFLSEGRPSLDPDYVPATTQTDKMRAKLLSTQKKLYSSKDIESMARKYKQKLVGDPVGGKSWGGDWEIELRNGVSLSYEYGPNSTYIKGWKFDRKAIQKYIGKYANEHETPRDYAPMGGKVLVGGLEAAFEVISEETIGDVLDQIVVEAELEEASSKKARNKAADEIEAIADKGGAEAPALFSLASKLRKGTHSTTGLKLSKQVTSILKANGIKEEVEEGWKKGKYTIKDNKGKILGTYNSGGKAQKAMDDLMQKGDYDKLEVSMVEEIELDEASRSDTKISGKLLAKRMRTMKKMKPFASKFEKMKTVSVIDLERELPANKVSIADIDSLMSDFGWSKAMREEAPANSVAGGNVNLDPFKKKRKNAKVETESFAGSMVFIVPPNVYYDSRLGKSRYLRYEKFVGNDKLGEAIRQYGKENPNSAIILKNSVNGAMLYLKYGKK